MRSRWADRGDQRGAVVAEVAVALPAIALVILFGIGSLSAASRVVRLQDAAADAARLAARGEGADRIAAAVATGLPGAGSTVDRRGDLVCVTATAPAPLVGSVTATGCALDGGR